MAARFPLHQARPVQFPDYRGSLIWYAPIIARTARLANWGLARVLFTRRRRATEIRRGSLTLTARYCTGGRDRVNCGAMGVYLTGRLGSVGLLLALAVGMTLLGGCDSGVEEAGPVARPAAVEGAEAVPAVSLMPSPIPTPRSLPLSGEGTERQGALVIRPPGRDKGSNGGTEEPLPTVAKPKPIATVPPTPIPTRVPAPTATAMPTPTATGTPTPTTLPTPTLTREPTATLQPTATPKPTLVPTATASPTPRPTTVPTSTPTPTPAPTSTATPTPYPANTGLVIECIFFDGVVPRSEADEYVQIRNGGTRAVELMGWRLTDVADGQPKFKFGDSYVLAVGERVRVYTNQVHSQWGGFSFGSRNSIWNNGEPDRAGLFDPTGRLVSERSYPPGC